MLEAVGHPVAVNPDTRLGAAAAERGWPVVIFRRRTKQVVRRSTAGAAAASLAGASFAAGPADRQAPLTIGQRPEPRSPFGTWCHQVPPGDRGHAEMRPADGGIGPSLSVVRTAETRLRIVMMGPTEGSVRPR